MEGLLEFASGPLFRFSVVIMILGLARILLLDLVGLIGAYHRAGDKSMPWGLVISRSLEWWFPVKRVMHNRPIYSVLSIIFHIGLILVPVFLYAHVQLWKNSLGIAWPTLPATVADILTITTVAGGIGLIIGRLASRSSSFLSRTQDFLWPVILLVPFTTGLICANFSVAPSLYQVWMLAHILSADLIFLLIPFTKIAHCVLMPLSQVVSTVAWKFPPETDEAVCETLNKKGAPV